MKESVEQQPKRLRAIGDADEAFIQTLWDEHGDALFGYKTRMTRDRGRAED